MTDNAQELNFTAWPPVGEDCLARYATYKTEWYKAKIVGKDSLSIVGRWLEGPKVSQLFEYTLQSSFRPIFNEAEKKREETINAATKDMALNFQRPRSFYVAYCEFLYDAGMLKRTDK
jgi:hypothetical protein